MSLSTCPSCGGNLASECRCPSCGKFLNAAAKQPEPMILTPELLEWAKQQFNDEEMIAGVEEIRRTGGKELHEFFHELEVEAARGD